ncbi:TCAF factor, partial [Podargus strigoides]|nr:TCAF factor [Podargus strigoides]
YQMDSMEAYASLVKDVKSFAFTTSYHPGELLLIGDEAFPVLVSTNGQVLIAASRYGKGRMVVVSHEGILKDSKFSQFLRNAVEWLKPSPEALVGIHPHLDSLSQLLLRAGTKVQAGAELSPSVGVFCVDAYDGTRAEDLVGFVKGGGGLLVGGQAWYWASRHGKEKVLFEFPGNQVTSVAGVYFTGSVGETGTFSVSKEMPRIPLITQHGLDVEKNLESLLKGVTEFKIEDGTAPSHLLIHGALAFPIAMNDSHQAFLAAAHYGRGRVVVLTHENFFQASTMKTFILNAIGWLDAGRGGQVGVADDLQEFFTLLSQEKIPCKLTDIEENLSVYCCKAYGDEELEKIHEFVSTGGGLLVGGQAWSWAAGNADKNAIAEFPGNKILHKFGVGILGDHILESTQPVSRPHEVVSQYHFRKALSQLQQNLKKKEALKAPYSSWLKKLAQDSGEFLRIPAQTSLAIYSVQQEMAELVLSQGVPDVTADSPIKGSSEEMVLINIAAELYDNFPDVREQICAPNQNLPEMTISPTVTVQIDGRNEGPEAWRSTGLYIPPRRTATLHFPASAVAANLEVQVGCHTDDLSSAEELKRPPLVVKKFKVEKTTVEVSSLWGGLIYIIVPEESTLGQISVTIKEAVQAPFFKLGETSISAWQSTIRQYPAPWAELATENITLTVPAADVRHMDNPERLLAIWSKMMKAIAKLAAIPATFPRPERMVADVQISHGKQICQDCVWFTFPTGWMHAGYPVMHHLESVAEVTDVQSLQANGLWAAIHELGHNQQQPEWEFPPHTTEATCNLWSVYVNETVLGIPRDKAHDALAPELRKKRIQDYIENGAQLKDWEVFTALETYLQLQEAFGWEAFTEIFSEYQNMSEHPDDNDSKMNLWAETFSRLVKKDLSPFFKAWGWPIKESLSQQLASSLPSWSDDPMKEYI